MALASGAFARGYTVAALGGGGLALRVSRDRSVLTPRRRLVDEAEMTAGLVTDALMMAIWRRGKPDALPHHSDQGSQ
jgi:hypothetical protein